jgi:hypothetical protein
MGIQAWTHDIEQEQRLPFVDKNPDSLLPLLLFQRATLLQDPLCASEHNDVIGKPKPYR